MSARSHRRGSSVHSFGRYSRASIDQLDRPFPKHRTRPPDSCPVCPAGRSTAAPPRQIVRLSSQRRFRRGTVPCRLSRRATVRVGRDPIHDRAIVPRGVGQKILQHLVVAVGDRLNHALHVAFVRLHQAAKILLGRPGHVVVSRAEQPPYSLNRPKVSPKSSSNLPRRIPSLSPRFGKFQHDPVLSENCRSNSTPVYQISCYFKGLKVIKWNRNYSQNENRRQERPASWFEELYEVAVIGCETRWNSAMPRADMPKDMRSKGHSTAKRAGRR